MINPDPGVFSELTGKELDALRLRAMRRRHSLTQKELDELAGVPLGVVGQLELARDYRKPRISELEAIARVLHCAVMDIFPATMSYLHTATVEYLSYENHPADEDGVPAVPRRGVQFA